MINNLFGGEEETKKEIVNYLEDSDDENDNLVTVDDIKCKEEFIETQKEKFNKVKVVSLKEIINKEIGKRYEKEYIYGDGNTGKNIIKIFIKLITMISHKHPLSIFQNQYVFLEYYNKEYYAGHQIHQGE